MHTRIYRQGDLLQPSRTAVQMSCPLHSLNLNAQELYNLKLLAGERVNYDKEELILFCDRFPFLEQNKRWLRDTLKTLIRESQVFWNNV